MKRTALFTAHQKLGGKLIEFGGWEMPVQYTSITDEHLAVRRAAGLFDISHMGEALIQGPGAEKFINEILSNDIRKLAVGRGQYTLMCNEKGGVIDDLYAYRLAGQEYLLIINASRIENDVEWLRARLAKTGPGAAVTLEDASDQFGAVAVQGPRVPEFIDKVFVGPSRAGTSINKVSELKKNQIAKILFDTTELWVARTGYTGEDGFEAVFPAGASEAVWNCLLAVGGPHGLKPAGLGARDTLRTEVCYPLYGQELDEATTPMEAGLGVFVSFDKGQFVGRGVLAEQKAQGTTKRLVAFKMTGKSAPPRPHYPIWGTGVAGVRLGEVTSGTQSPSLGIGIGMGYLPAGNAAGTAIEIEIRGNRAPAVVVPKPIYRKPH